MKDSSKFQLDTKCIHAGQTPDPYSGALMTPISMSSTFAQKGPLNYYPGKYEYSRSANPTRDTFERCLAALENGKYGLAFGSGLGASQSVLNILKAGDHVISIDDVYGGTRRLMVTVAEKFGLKFSFVNLAAKDEGKGLKEAFTDNTKMVWLETPTNPTLKISDIKLIAGICKEKGAILVVDNTFMSSYFQKPLDLGADFVLHSCTKYLGGHSDVVMGAVVCKDDELHKRLRYVQNSCGIVPSPFDSYLVLRSLKTLHVRLARHEKNAKVLAEYLENHKNVEKVIYPGLKSHPQHELAKKQMTGFGGMITFYIKGDIFNAKKFLESTELFQCAESLGGVESLSESPALMTHASVPAEARKKLGISDTLIRLSVGIEDVNDLQRDLQSALQKAFTQVSCQVCDKCGTNKCNG